jgi:hypothetical protein
MGGNKISTNNQSEVPLKGSLPIEINKEIVKHLSIGLYRNYALAIKELISNSYDAGATEVKVKLDLKNKKIIIRDKGKGMDYNEFKREYLHIGYSKEPAKKPDDLGRMRIGTFGIGFLAPLPYCKRMIVITKKRGDDKALCATINAEDFFSKGTWKIKEAKVPYEIKDSDLPKKIGETIVILEDIQPQIAEDLTKKQVKTKATIDQLSGFDKFKWTLCQYTPIQFSPERKELREFFAYPRKVPLRLWLDGKELFRNVPTKAQILEKESKDFGDIKVKYSIFTPYSTIKPEEARGLQVRLRDVAIGFPRDFDVTKLGRVLGRLNFIGGEVHIIKGLDNALMVTRDSFNYTEEVAEIYKFFRDKLTEWNNKLCDEAEEDKKIYETLPEETADFIEDELKKAKIVKFAKKRFRISKTAIATKKTGPVSSPSKRLKEVLSKRRDFKIILSKEKRNKKESPIKIDSKQKSITIFEEHPSFLESIEVEKQKFAVSYDEWNYKKTPYSICRLDSKRKKVTFNSSHPLFKSKVNDRIIKQLSLGMLLILECEKDKEKILTKFNQLLEDAF